MTDQTAQHPAAPEAEHTPVDVYEMPEESAESLHARIEAGTAVLAFRVCEECAPAEVLERIEDGDLDLSDGDALAAQWPCEFVTPAAPEASSVWPKGRLVEHPTPGKVWVQVPHRNDIGSDWIEADVLPAAPETDVSEWESIMLDALHAAHHRPGSITMLDLARSLAEIVAPEVADRMRVVEGEREEWIRVAHTHLCGLIAEAKAGDLANARAESAEAALDALRAGIEALVADAVHADFTMHPETDDDVVLAVRAIDLVHLLPGDVR